MFSDKMTQPPLPTRKSCAKLYPYFLRLSNMFQLNSLLKVVFSKILFLCNVHSFIIIHFIGDSFFTIVRNKSFVMKICNVCKVIISLLILISLEELPGTVMTSQGGLHQIQSYQLKEQNFITYGGRKIQKQIDGNQVMNMTRQCD